jgi:hypothetical protein
MEITMGSETERQDPTPWQAGFADGLTGRRSPSENQRAYRSGYIAGSARRISRRTMMAVALATLVAPNRDALAALEPDPIFAAIERHRQAWETLKSAPHDDDQMRLHEAVLIAESEVVNIRPTTTAGVVALRTYHREHRYRERTYPTPYPGGYSNWGKG